MVQREKLQHMKTHQGQPLYQQISICTTPYRPRRVLHGPLFGCPFRIHSNQRCDFLLTTFQICGFLPFSPPKSSGYSELQWGRGLGDPPTTRFFSFWCWTILMGDLYFCSGQMVWQDCHCLSWADASHLTTIQPQVRGQDGTHLMLINKSFAQPENI